MIRFFVIPKDFKKGHLQRTSELKPETYKLTFSLVFQLVGVKRKIIITS